MRDGDEDQARQQIQRLRSLDPGPEVLEMLVKYEGLLEGRRLARSLQLGLTAEALPDGPGSYRLLATLRHGEPEPLRLDFHPLQLRELSTAVHLVTMPDPSAPDGERLDALEQRTSDRRSLDLLDGLVLLPGETRVLDLGVQSAPDPRAFAVRRLWQLTSRSGVVERDGETYPIQLLPTANCERTRRASWLPVAAVPPEEWLHYALGANVELAALMERAVRIDASRREEALDLLTAELDHLPPLRLQALVPAIRWLARTPDPGGEGEAWALWLRARAQVASSHAQTAREQRWAEERSDEELDPIGFERAGLEEDGLERGAPVPDRPLELPDRPRSKAGAPEPDPAEAQDAASEPGKLDLPGPR